MRSISDFYPTKIEEGQQVLLMPFLEKQDGTDDPHTGREGRAARRTGSADDLKVRLFYKAIDLSG